MARMATPADYWLLGMRSARMMAEAQMVIGLRLLGMAGGWTVSPSESARMMQEKGPVFIKSARNATSAALKGRRPDQIAEAALRPIGAKTRANARRLSKGRRR